MRIVAAGAGASRRVVFMSDVHESNIENIHDMLVVGSGGEPTPGCYHGGACTTYPQKGDVRDAILQDEIGLKSARNLGIRVAKTLNMLK